MSTRPDRFTSAGDLAALNAGSPSLDSAPETREAPAKSAQDERAPAWTPSAPPALLSVAPAPTSQGLADLSALPNTLRSRLDRRAKLVALHLLRGDTWAQALNAIRATKAQKSKLISDFPLIRAAVEHWIGELATSAAASRIWILRQLVELHGRATTAVPVLDRSGDPTGEYRFDGATAARVLELLGKDQGMFGAKSGKFDREDVAALIAAVSARGRPALPGTVIGAMQHERPALPHLQAVDQSK